jgi:stearoyl-CoA desaturase (delta-9 desaturase)
MLLAFGLFFFGYFISMTFTSIFYHRALAHEALEISERFKKFIGLTGMMVTGIDPKGWVCMHRLHHQHSDTPLDPHSPAHTGFWYTFIKQHKSFERILVKLIKKDPQYERVVSDIPFDVHYLNKIGLWYLPFVLHGLLGFVIAQYVENAWAGVAYFFGICGHPLQGFLVNAFGHSIGYRNFDCPDQSTNNTFVALTCFGEGYQNNHHRFPSSPKFSLRFFEIDPGYGVVKVLSTLGMLKIKHQQIPNPKLDPYPQSDALESN